MSDSQRPHGLQPTRPLHPWDFPGKSTGVGSLMRILTYYTLDFFLKNCLFTYVWLCWVSVTLHGLFSSRCKQGLPSSCVHGLLIVVASRCRAQALGHPDSAVVAHRLSCSKACGIFPDQGSNPSPLHWQGSPIP